MDLIIAAAILGVSILGAAERWRRAGGRERHEVQVAITVQDEVVPPLVTVVPDRPYIAPKNHHTQGALGFGQFSPADTRMRT